MGYKGNLIHSGKTEWFLRGPWDRGSGVFPISQWGRLRLLQIASFSDDINAGVRFENQEVHELLRVGVGVGVGVREGENELRGLGWAGLVQHC